MSITRTKSETASRSSFRAATGRSNCSQTPAMSLIKISHILAGWRPACAEASADRRPPSQACSTARTKSSYTRVRSPNSISLPNRASSRRGCEGFMLDVCGVKLADGPMPQFLQTASDTGEFPAQRTELFLTSVEDRSRHGSPNEVEVLGNYSLNFRSQSDGLVVVRTRPEEGSDVFPCLFAKLELRRSAAARRIGQSERNLRHDSPRAVKIRWPRQRTVSVRSDHGWNKAQRMVGRVVGRKFRIVSILPEKRRARPASPRSRPL